MILSPVIYYEFSNASLGLILIECNNSGVYVMTLFLEFLL